MKTTAGPRRQELTRKARQAVLWGLGAFVALQLGLTLAMESWWCVLRDPAYGFKIARLKQRLREGAGQTRAGERPYLVVMVGSSRVADGLRGQLIEEYLGRQLGRPVIVFNFGNPADGPLAELLNFERLLADGVRPDLLLVEVLPTYLSKHADVHLYDLPAERLGVRDRVVLHLHGMPVKGLARYSELNWALPCYAHRFEILSVLTPRFLPEPLRQDRTRKLDDSGWVTPWYDPTPENRKKASDIALGVYGKVLHEFKMGNRFLSAFDRLLGRCQEEGIASALVLMPEGKPFRERYPPEVLQQLEVFLEDLSTRHDAPVVNARDWVADEQFFDYHHLLPDGGSVFTTRLGQEAILPLLGGSYRAGRHVTLRGTGSPRIP